jgi:hypothetical protein
VPALDQVSYKKGDGQAPTGYYYPLVCVRCMTHRRSCAWQRFAPPIFLN